MHQTWYHDTGYSIKRHSIRESSGGDGGRPTTIRCRCVLEFVVAVFVDDSNFAVAVVYISILVTVVIFIICRCGTCNVMPYTNNRHGSHSSKRHGRGTSRRQALALLGAGAAAGLAGCAGGGNGDDDDDPGADLSDVELYDADGNRIEPTIIYDSGDGTAEDIASECQRNLEQIGVDLQLDARPEVLGEDFHSEPLDDADPDEFEWRAGRNAGPPDQTRTVYDWDLLHGIGANAYPRTPYDTRVFWRADDPLNAYGYVPEEDLAGLYEEFDDVTDEQERQAIWDEISAALTHELPANFMYSSYDFEGFLQDINTEPEFYEYGYTPGTINRYRGEQEVGGDFVRLDATPLSEPFLPEQDDNNSAMRTDLLTDASYAIDGDNEIVPLHIDIEDAGDSQVWVCTLRDNLEFGTDADGNAYGQMTAEDWVFQLEYVHGVADDAADLWDEEFPPSEALGNYEVVENVEQTGELEFQLELVEPDPAFSLRPVIWGEQILPQELFEEYAPDAEALRESTEVTEFTWTGNLGPYTFDDWVAGASGSFTATRNEDYYMREHTADSNVQVMDDAWADAPYFETYQFDVEDERSTRLERFRAGEGDRMLLPSDNVAEFEQDHDDIRVEDQQSPYVNFLFFNQRSNGSPICRERDGREAMARVIDKETITDDILRERAQPVHSNQPPWSEWYDEDVATEYGVDITEEDIVQARELLEENETFVLEEA
ncbi:ABC transporter substrate-binding protein [Natronobacterium gregoryi SP2]|uniref:ABC transporter substrate-binding protein n=1 Tax=Natronobacterium gregoryi (strain ATCC 43098 / DSM 3393 / CCM 3738 / CIP 104747 / IAM 13177 / JCM 8860 / NBRC 102187 / NCIMB 2189 / SP2) TaxID=797304 RepID=A0A2J4JG61_NATGS|nr:ABC transporter substrate-binding protein [Natronobacterium gregoryi SP2]